MTDRPEDETDVPIRVDFRDPATCRTWIEDTQMVEHLGELAHRVTFVERDFREAAWAEGLGAFDAVVTLQAAHETRHHRHLVPLLSRARTVIVEGGVLLYADHYRTPETKLPALAPTREEQPRALERAGFVGVTLVYEEGAMALWSARA
jgi:hypothetical protein